MRDLIGRTLGHYRIVNKIGEGGMGAISSRSTECGSSPRRFVSPFRLQPPVRGVLVAAAFGRWIGVLAALCRADSPGRRFLLIQEGARRVGTRPAAPERL